MIQFFIALMLSLGAYAGTGIETREFSAADLKTLLVKNKNGRITVSAAAGTQATVKVTKIKFEEKCKLTIEKKGSELFVITDDRGFLESNDCQADMEILAPKAVDAKIVAGSGDIKINGLNGELDYLIGSGQLKASGEFKNLRGKTGSGQVQIDGLVGNGDLASGSGGIQVKFSPLIKNGKFNFKTASGNATLLFAKGSKIKADLKAASGTLSNEIGNTATSKFKVSMKAGSGNLDIKSY